MKRILRAILGLAAVLSQVLAAPQAFAAGPTLPPVNLPPSLSDIGGCSSAPWFGLFKGQSREQGEDPGGSASVTATLSGTTLTVTSVAFGTIIPGSTTLTGADGTVEKVMAAGTGTGGVGTYTVSTSATVASEAWTATPSYTASLTGSSLLTVAGANGGTIVPGSTVMTGADGTVLSVLAPQVSGPHGGAGQYSVSVTTAGTALSGGAVSSQLWTAPKAVAPNVFIVNDNLAGTALVPAAYGTAPLGINGGPDNVGSPNLAAVNQAASFANHLRADWAGTCSANRPIIIIPSWLGGRSLINWVTPPSVTVVAGGTGFALGNQVPLADGVVLQVTGVLGGAITSAAITTPGPATNYPATGVAQGSTSATGTGATFNLGTWGQGPYFADLLRQLAVVNAAYPGFTLDHMDFAQGDADGDPNTLSAIPQTGFGSRASYDAALAQLITFDRALPQWRNAPTAAGGPTTSSLQELGADYDNEIGAPRQDVLQTYRNGARDPWITTVSMSGAVESVVVPPHENGVWEDIIADRHVQAFLAGSLNRGYHNGTSVDATTGSAETVAQVLTVPQGATAYATIDMMRSGRLHIDVTGGGSTPATVYLPNFTAIKGVLGDVLITLDINGGNATVAINGLTGSLTQGSIIGPSVSGSSVSFSGGNYTCVLGTSTYQCQQFNFKVGDFQLYAGVQRGANNTYTLPNAWAAGGIALLQGGDTVTMPTLSNGLWGAVWNTGSAATTLTVANASYPFVRPGGGATATTLTVYPNEFLLFMVAGNEWEIVEDSNATSTCTQVSASATPTITVTPGCHDTTLILTSASAVTSLAIVLPGGPVDGARVSVIAKSAVSGITYSGGTNAGTLATSEAAGYRGSLAVYAAGSSAWN